MASTWQERGFGHLWLRTRRGLAAVAVIALPAMAMSPTAAWAVPSQITLEGALTSSGGGAAPDGSYNVVFGIYKDAAGGSPIWSEGPVSVLVKNGLFAYAIGTKTPLTPAALANLGTAFLGVKVEADAELPRQQVLSTVYALRAGIAEGVDCSGCIAAGALDPTVLAPYAKTADLAAYAKAADLGAYAKSTDLAAYAKATDLGAYAKATDLAAYAKTASLKDVATTGAYASLTGTPVLDDVATSGSYNDLINKPVMAAINSQCGTNLFVKGINADGSLNCGPITLSTEALLAAMPKDGLNEISNDLLSNQFTDSASGTSGLAIWDNSPIGFQVVSGTPPVAVAAPDVIAFPDIGFAQKLTVNLDVSNSDVSTLEVLLTAPDKTVYYLCGPVTPAPNPWPAGLPTGTPCGSGGKFVKSFGDPSLGHTKPVSGDLTTWVTKNPTGDWKLQVYDTAYLNNLKDGQVNSWSISLSTLSSKKVQVKSDLYVDGSTFLGNDKAGCDAAHKGALRFEATAGLQVCQSNVATNDSITYTWAAAIAQPIIWSGGCKSHSQGYGWATYCLDGTDFNTASNYLSVAANGIVTVKVSGFYRMDFYTIQHGCGQQDLQFMINEAGFAYSHVANRTYGGWQINALANVAKLKAGDTFYVRALRENDGCNANPYRWHLWNPNGAHSRLQMTYSGPLMN